MPLLDHEIEAAQRAWGDGIVGIGQAFQQGADYRARALELIADLYSYHLGTVLFCPTMAANPQFRTTVEGALSYFVGDNAEFSEDQGFALRPWASVRFENVAVISQVDSALTMGNYFFQDGEGTEFKVEYSFGYIRGPDGEILIRLHHSSLPYSP
jgi:hypothetical protein